MKLNIRCFPHSGRQEIEKIETSDSTTSYKVYLKSNPEDNKANIELLKFLKKHFKVQNIKLIKGRTSRNKVVEVN
ncbi:MAG: DUF167 domain-containing protein [archaeon]